MLQIPLAHVEVPQQSLVDEQEPPALVQVVDAEQTLPLHMLPGQQRLPPPQLAPTARHWEKAVLVGEVVVEVGWLVSQPVAARAAARRTIRNGHCPFAIFIT